MEAHNAPKTVSHEDIVVSVINTEELYPGRTDTLHVHVNVEDADGWVGDFWVDFNRRGRLETRQFVADWSDVKSGGNGLYVDDHPTFWLVEAAREILNDHFTTEFKTIDSGPNDK